jgi:capsid assembly protease
MKKKLNRVGSIVNGVPWAIEPRAMDVISDIFQRHIDGAEIPDVGTENEGGADFVNGVAVFTIMGPVIPRANLMSNVSGATSSEEIVSAMKRFASDDAVKAVVLDIDSPGGSVLGGFEAADAIADLANYKPVISSVSGMACSLAYLFASQCDEIYATRASVIGSIGVIARIQSTDRMAKNEGVDTITVATSRHKAMAGLTEDEMRAELQAEVDKYMSMFAAALEDKRADRMDVSAVSNGKTWLATDAEELGLVDGIKSRDEVIEAAVRLIHAD